MKKVFLFILVSFFTTKMFASHISGGELFYEYLGPGISPNSDRFKITMRLYRECESSGAELNNEQVTIGIYFNSNNNLFGTIPLAAQWVGDPPVFQNSPDAIPCLTGDKVVCFQVGTFSNSVDLPRNTTGYLLSWIRFSRQELTNIADDPYPENAVGATFITRIPGTNLINTGFNSSPQFVSSDTALVCGGKDFSLDYGAIDPDGDSLSYSFRAAYNGGDNALPNPPPPPNLRLIELPYLAPFSGGSPMGSGVKINPKTGIITGTAPTIGKYVVNVTVTEWRNGIALNDHQKDFIVKVGDCQLAAATLKPSYLTCDGFTLTFENQSTSADINSYYWNFGDGSTNADTSLLPKPTYTFQDSGTYTIKLIINRGEKCSDSTIAKALVYPGFIPDFKVDGSCAINPYKFTDLTTTKYGFVDSWYWDFGDLSVLSDTSLLQNPVYKYPSPQTVTTLFIVTNSKGCKDSLTKTLVVPDRPTISLPFKDTLICISDTLQLLAKSTSAAATYSWFPPTFISNTTINDPLVFPPGTTSYIVTVNDKGCINTDTVTVNVISTVQLSIGRDTTICLTDNVQLQPVSNALRFSWSPPLGLSDSTAKNPFASPLKTTQYKLVASVGSCSTSDVINIKPVPYPTANASVDTSICFGKTTVLKASITASQYTWSPVSTLLNENTLTPVAGPQNTTSYILMVTDVLGCPKPVSDTVTVTVIPKLPAFAGRDTAIVAGQSLQLNASGGLIYTWSPSTGMDNPNISNPILNLNAGYDTITYRVRVSTPEGCAATDDIKITVFKTQPDIFIPTAFTPNGDRLNDVLIPKAVGMKQFNYFRVYNRWGVMLYSTTQQGQGWDGTYAGTAQASGTYVFAAQAIDYTGKPIIKKGTVVLIR